MHRIRRQILDLELPRETGAVALQREVGRVFQEKVLPQLDAVFSRIAPPDRVVRIDRLEIDLGAVGESNWEQHFIEECVRQITRQAEFAIFDVSEETGQSLESFSADERVWNTFLHFLQNGTLPWYSREMTLRVLEVKVLESIHRFPAPWTETWRSALWEQPALLKRLTWQFSAAFRRTVLEKVAGWPDGWLEHAEKILQLQLGRDLFSEERIRLYQTLLTHVDSHTTPMPVPDITWVTRLYFAAEGTAPHDVAPTASKDIPAFLTRDAAAHETAKTYFAADTPDTSRPSAREIEQATFDGSPKTPGTGPLPPDASKQSTQQAEPAFPGKSGASASGLDDLEDGIFVDFAGLVILAVYLPTFFQALDLINDQVFRDDHARYKAVHLLNFLGSSQPNPEEPTLVLPKILCGMSPEDLVPAELELSDVEKNECDTLLEAVIRNWSVLKNTSPDGLRQGFLQRPGKLSWRKNQSAWLLQPERLGQDILLERLPWTYSVIKLPWMPTIMLVEW